MNAIDVCPVCERMTFHISDSTCVCSNCDYSIGAEEYWSASSIASHLRGVQQRQNKEEAESADHPCRICGEALASKVELAEHVDRKHEVREVVS